MTNYLADQLLESHSESERVFLLLDDGSEIRYRAFCDRVNQVANFMVACNVQPRDRIAVQVEKSWQVLALYLGVIKAGGVFLPLNIAYTAKEIQYFIEDAEPKIFVCDTAREDELREIVTAVDAGLLTLDSDGSGAFFAAVDAYDTVFASVSREADDLAAILYTSGTTGRSKGAMLSHDNLWSNAEVLVETWQFSDEDMLLHALPIFHTHGLFVAVNTCLIAGAGMIFLDKFDSALMIKHLPQSTCMMGVPTFYTRLLDESDFNQDLVQHMRLFVSGSAPLLAETHVQFEERAGHRILERYGLTETNMNTSNPYEGDRRAGTVGPQLSGVTIRVVDQNNVNVAAGKIGSIQVQGANVFQGYWRMPEKTAEEFTADGFFITGDLGCLNDDGYLTIVGRDKDLIISGGYNIYPKEIELVLDMLPGVTESAVVGVSHGDFGEGVVAILVGVDLPDEAAVKEMVSDQLARFKQPRRVFHLDALPRNTMGKVQKNVLREQYQHCFKD